MSFETLTQTIQKLQSRFGTISTERKQLLEELTSFIQDRVNNGKDIRLNFICTHNSRRSHLAQIWAQTSATVYRIPKVICYSGGTEATAFNPRAVTAMRETGFLIETEKEGENPLYAVHFSNEAAPLKVFSKKYDDPFNQLNDFAAVMTCSHADDNCPLIPGAKARIAITYDDPKNFDGTPLEAEKYTERVEQIGTEMLYVFSKVKRK